MIITNMEHYGYFIDQFPDASAKTVGWSSEEKQKKCFSVLTGIIENDEGSVLDVGCGCGHLSLEFLDKPLISYMGIDSHPEMIKLASSVSIKGLFQNRDLESFDLINDYVIACGIFNLKKSETGSMQYRYLEDSISKMISLAKKGVAFNLLKSLPYGPDLSELYFYKVDKVCRLMERMGVKYSIRCDYDDSDFSVFIYK